MKIGAIREEDFDAVISRAKLKRNNLDCSSQHHYSMHFEDTHLPSPAISGLQNNFFPHVCIE